MAPKSVSDPVLLTLRLFPSLLCLFLEVPRMPWARAPSRPLDPPSLCPGLSLQINLSFRLQVILPWNACLGADAAMWSPGMPSSGGNTHTTVAAL